MFQWFGTSSGTSAFRVLVIQQRSLIRRAQARKTTMLCMRVHKRQFSGTDHGVALAAFFTADSRDTSHVCGAIAGPGCMRRMVRRCSSLELSDGRADTAASASDGCENRRGGLQSKIFYACGFIFHGAPKPRRTERYCPWQFGGFHVSPAALGALGAISQP